MNLDAAHIGKGSRYLLATQTETFVEKFYDPLECTEIMKDDRDGGLCV